MWEAQGGFQKWHIESNKKKKQPGDFLSLSLLTQWKNTSENVGESSSKSTS